MQINSKTDNFFNKETEKQMDVNRPIENSKLLSKLEALKANYSSESEFDFFKELASSFLLAPITKDSLAASSKARSTLEEESSISFTHLTDDFGNKYIPAFTDWNELAKWQALGDVKTIILSFDDYKTLILHSKSTFDGLVLNPFGHNIVFNKDLIQQIDNCVTKVKKDETVLLGIPREYPQQMVDAIKADFASFGYVKSAYLLSMIRGETDKSFLLVIDSSGNISALYKRTAEIAQSYLGQDEKLDIVGLASDFGRSAVEGLAPFYQKL